MYGSPGIICGKSVGNGERDFRGVRHSDNCFLVAS